MRMQGHAQHDDARYVPKAMLDDWAAKDPLQRFRRVVLEREGRRPRRRSTTSTRWRRAMRPPRRTSPSRSRCPIPPSVARGVYAGDDYAVPKVELVKSPFAAESAQVERLNAMAVITYLEAIRQALFDEMAARRARLRHRRRRRRLRRRVQGDRRAAGEVRRERGSSTRRSPKRRSSGPRSARRTWACGRCARSSSSISSPAASTC